MFYWCYTTILAWVCIKLPSVLNCPLIVRTGITTVQTRWWWSSNTPGWFLHLCVVTLTRQTCCTCSGSQVDSSLLANAFCNLSIIIVDKLDISLWWLSNNTILIPSYLHLWKTGWLLLWHSDQTHYFFSEWQRVVNSLSPVLMSACCTDLITCHQCLVYCKKHIFSHKSGVAEKVIWDFGRLNVYRIILFLYMSSSINEAMIQKVQTNPQHNVCKVRFCYKTRYVKSLYFFLLQLDGSLGSIFNDSLVTTLYWCSD